MRISIIDFIVIEIAIIIVSCILAKLIMDAIVLMQLYMQYEDPDPEEATSAPGITINLKNAASKHMYRIKWITGTIPGYRFNVGDHVEVLVNTGKHLVIKHFAMGEVYLVTIDSSDADRLQVEVDDHAYFLK